MVRAPPMAALEAAHTATMAQVLSCTTSSAHRLQVHIGKIRDQSSLCISINMQRCASCRSLTDKLAGVLMGMKGLVDMCR